jgi:hypothetical protein
MDPLTLLQRQQQSRSNPIRNQTTPNSTDNLKTNTTSSNNHIQVVLVHRDQYNDFDHHSELYNNSNNQLHDTTTGDDEPLSSTKPNHPMISTTIPWSSLLPPSNVTMTMTSDKATTSSSSSSTNITEDLELYATVMNRMAQQFSTVLQLVNNSISSSLSPKHEQYPKQQPDGKKLYHQEMEPKVSVSPKGNISYPKGSLSSTSALPPVLIPVRWDIEFRRGLQFLPLTLPTISSSISKQIITPTMTSSSSILFRNNDILRHQFITPIVEWMPSVVPASSSFGPMGTNNNKDTTTSNSGRIRIWIQGYPSSNHSTMGKEMQQHDDENETAGAITIRFDAYYSSP